MGFMCLQIGGSSSLCSVHADSSDPGCTQAEAEFLGINGKRGGSRCEFRHLHHPQPRWKGLRWKAETAG